MIFGAMTGENKNQAFRKPLLQLSSDIAPAERGPLQIQLRNQDIPRLRRPDEIQGLLSSFEHAEPKVPSQAKLNEAT